MPLTKPQTRGYSDAAVRGGGEGKLYAQVAGLIRRRIREKIWQPGDRLPSLEELTREFSVSLITVRRAVELLEHEGILKRVQGRGTFVARTANAREWLRLQTTWDDILKGYEEGKGQRRNEVIEQKASCQLPGREDSGQESENRLFRYMCRRHLVDEVPYAYTDLYLDEAIYELAPGAFEEEMVLKVLATHPKIKIGPAHQIITLGTADSRTANLLNVSAGSPVGELLRTVFDPADQLIYRGKVTYRGDLVRIETRLK